MNPPPESFVTARLRLRRPVPTDAQDVFEYASDKEVTRYLSFKTHTRVETAEGYLRDLAAAAERGERYAWALTRAGSDRLIGMIAIRIRPPSGELGYVLGRPFWRQGYMAEAIEPVVEWALRQDLIYRVWAFCDVENRASGRVLEKVGMEREGILRKWFVHPNVSDVPRDCYCYSIVRG